MRGITPTMHERVSAIAALGKNNGYNGGGIGKNGQLLWHIPEDLQRFKELTLGHPIIMGRKTFDSIIQVLGRPLPGRISIVMTRDPFWSYPGAVVAHSIQEALAEARSLGSDEIFIGGGAEVYREALPYTNRLYLTLIDDEKEADSFFPDYSEFTKEIFRESHTWNGVRFEWVDLERE